MSRPSSTILLILLAGVLGGCGDEAAEDPAPEFEEDRDLKDGPTGRQSCPHGVVTEAKEEKTK